MLLSAVELLYLNRSVFWQNLANVFRCYIQYLASNIRGLNIKSNDIYMGVLAEQIYPRSHITHLIWYRVKISYIYIQTYVDYHCRVILLIPSAMRKENHGNAVSGFNFCVAFINPRNNIVRPFLIRLKF